jgi:prepilin-type N-terminal cleavage/methylation domain-containing protein
MNTDPTKAPSRSLRSPASAGPRGPAGFTMVEVIVAIVVLTVGVLGMAGTTAYVVRQVTLGDLMTKRAVALQGAIEGLQAMPFDSVGSGTDSVGVFVVRWTSTAESSTSRIVTLVTTGPGLRTSSGDPFPVLGPDVADTFQYRVISR